MAVATSFNVKPAKLGAARHNSREKSYDYIFRDRTHLNECWTAPGFESVARERARLAEAYQKHYGQKMQARAHPIHEGVLVINEDTSMEQVQAFASEMERRFNVVPLQIAIHRDEGYEEEDFVEDAPEDQRHYNFHAHILFRWCDEHGRTFKWNNATGREFQDIAARCLGMNRGRPSDTKHLTPQQYKYRQEISSLQRQQELERMTLEELQEQTKTAERSLKAQNSQLAGFQQKIDDLTARRDELIAEINSSTEERDRIQQELDEVNEDLADMQEKYDRKQELIRSKEDELNDLLKALSVKCEYTPLEKISVEMPVIGKPNMWNQKEWVREQNDMIRATVGKAYQVIRQKLEEDARQQVKAAQARVAGQIKATEDELKATRKENEQQRRIIACQRHQLQAERMPDKHLLTHAAIRTIGEFGDHFRLSGRYASVPFDLSLSSDQCRVRSLGLDDREVALVFLPDILVTCFDWDRELAENPEIRHSVVSEFVSLVGGDPAFSRSEGGGGSSSSLRWDGKDPDDFRQDLFRQAYAHVCLGGLRGVRRR